MSRFLNLCMKCGYIDSHSVMPCPNCGYDPPDPLEKMRGRYGSEQYFTAEELRALSLRIRAGESIDLDPPDMLARYRRRQRERLIEEHGTIPPPWVILDVHPYSIGWRMGYGEDHMTLWWRWWEEQPWGEPERIAYFQHWHPPKRWLAFVIRAIWPDLQDDEGIHPPDAGFERTAQLGWGTRAEYERDLSDPKWQKM